MGYNYDLSDQVSDCFINPIIQHKAQFIKMELFVKPKSGIFESIEFKPTIYYNGGDTCQAPKVYNDRKIFHPNIDIYTNEIAVPELQNWNPAQQITFLIRRIKYVLIEANLSHIPNNNLNKKAGYFYLFSRETFRIKVLENCPSLLEQQVGSLALHDDSWMDEEPTSTKFIDIRSLLPKSRLADDDSALEMNLITKKLKHMNVNLEEDTEGMEI